MNNNEAKKMNSEKKKNKPFCLTKLTQRQRVCRRTGECGGCSESDSGSDGGAASHQRVVSPHWQRVLMFNTLPRGFVLLQPTDTRLGSLKGRVRHRWWAPMSLPVCVCYHREGLVTCAPSAEGSSAKWEVRKWKKAKKKKNNQKPEKTSLSFCAL